MWINLALHFAIGKAFDFYFSIWSTFAQNEWKKYLLTSYLILNTFMWSTSLFIKRWPTTFHFGGLGSLSPLFLLQALKQSAGTCTLASLTLAGGRWCSTPKMSSFGYFKEIDWPEEVGLGSLNSYHFYFCREWGLHDLH